MVSDVQDSAEASAVEWRTGLEMGLAQIVEQVFQIAGWGVVLGLCGEGMIRWQKLSTWDVIVLIQCPAAWKSECARVSLKQFDKNNQS